MLWYEKQKRYIKKICGFWVPTTEKIEILTKVLPFLALITWYLTLIFEAIFVMQFNFFLFINIFHRGVIADIIYFIFNKKGGNRKVF